MCDTCGCNITPGNEHLVRPGGKHAETSSGHAAVEVLQNLLGENDHQAAHNRAHFDARGVLAVNLMSSPGSGKTSLLEATLDAIGQELRVAVIEGDLETENDAERIRAKGITAIQIATGSACHLDAHMVHEALHRLDLDDIDILFIENVGNLVCPASFDLGHHRNVTLLSVPEGDDKPAKYPVMFRAADLVLLTKADLLPVLDDFDAARAEGYLRQLASPAPFVALSARRDAASLDPWLDWLRSELAAQRARVAAGRTARPALQPDAALLHGGHAGHDHQDDDDHAHGHHHDHDHDHRHPHGHGHGHSHSHGHSHGPHVHDHAHEHAAGAKA
jgi:hydrogenase nickel incorporation protein HypB